MESKPSIIPSSREGQAASLLIGLVVLIGLIVLYAYFTRPPQMGTSEEVFKTVDALYTAVRSRDEKRMGDCEQRFKAYRKTGKLPSAAGNTLAGIIRTARSGSWESATEQLYNFMRAQRREGTIEHTDRKHDRQAEKGKVGRK